MRDPKLQQKAIDYGLKRGRPLIHAGKAGKAAITELSAYIRTKRKDGKKMHKTDIKGLNHGSYIWFWCTCAESGIKKIYIC